MSAARRAAIAMVAIAVAQLWLVSAVPLQVLAHAVQDDALFARLAMALLSGEWLGSYDSLTLVKGPFYPMWLAAVAWLGLPLLVAQDLLYLAAGALLLAFVWPRLRRWWVIAGLYAAYAFNPMLTTAGNLRIIREGIYTPLAVLLMALVLWWWHWRARGVAWRALPAGVLGIVFAAFWLTREEGPWLFPALATAALACALCGDTPVRIAVRLVREGGLVALAVLVAWSATHAVALVNKAHYGSAMVVEPRDADFLGAYGALSRIEHAAWRRHVAVPREAIRRAAEHSPAVAELLPWLDGAMADGWARESCNAIGEDPCQGDIHAGWFMWALLGAVERAGHYGTAEESRRFYRRLAEEVDGACADGRLTCLPPRATMAPPFRPDTLPLLAAGFRDGLLKMVRFEFVELERLQSTGRSIDYELISDLVGGPVFERGRNIWLRGIIQTSGPTIARIAVERADTAITYTAELVEHQRYRDGRVEVKFDLNTDCAFPDCALVVSDRHGPLARLAFDQIGERVESGPVTFLFADIIDSRDRLAPRDRRSDAAYLVLGQVAQVWRTISPVLAIIAFVAFLVAIAGCIHRRRLDRLSLAALIVLVAVGSRLFLLAYIDVVALPALNGLYLSPAVPLWILFLGLAPAAAVCAWRERRDDGGKT